jgi:predicted glycoside hydrolase/deacetylase ChbG (UPF0249 family)
MPAQESTEAWQRCTRAVRSRLSVGLHTNLTDSSARPLVDRQTGKRCRALLQQQLDRFRKLIGRPPIHLDFHQNLHRNPRLRPCFLEAADRDGLPLSEHSPVRYFSSEAVDLLARGLPAGDAAGGAT